MNFDLFLLVLKNGFIRFDGIHHHEANHHLVGICLVIFYQVPKHAQIEVSLPEGLAAPTKMPPQNWWDCKIVHYKDPY